MYYYPNPFFGRRGHFIKIGAPNSAIGLENPAISPIDAIAIDMKMDDGLGDSGNTVALDSLVAGCMTGGFSTVAPSSYIATNTTPSCRMYFWYDKN